MRFVHYTLRQVWTSGKQENLLPLIFPESPVPQYDQLGDLLRRGTMGRDMTSKMLGRSSVRELTCVVKTIVRSLRKEVSVLHSARRDNGSTPDVHLRTEGQYSCGRVKTSAYFINQHNYTARSQSANIYEISR
jgi:hypothetical protein